jgi:flagellar export protein FliJ
VKRYRFRLESVLTARQAQKRAAGTELACAQTALQAAVDAVADAEEHYRQLAAASPEHDDVVAVQAARQQAGFRVEAIAYRRRLAQGAAAQVEQARNAYVEASRAVSLLERLEERRYQEHTAETLREEAAVLDELAGGAFVRAQLEGRP